MSIHRYFHDLRIEVLLMYTARSTEFFLAILMLLFAAAFLVLGIMRYVEFHDFKFGRTRFWLMVSLHWIGCISFALGLALFALDPRMLYKNTLSYLLGTGFIIIVPQQIYMGLLRRVRFPQTKSSPTSPPRIRR